MLNNIENILWLIASIFLVFSGLYFTFRLKFPQFRFIKMFKSFNEDNVNKKGISSFSSLSLALGARIGVGSLSGIAIGLINGGSGSIFWLWLSTLICLPNSFVESTLAVKYHKLEGNFYKGGPSYYMEHGLNNKKLANIYALILSVCYLGGLIAIQANTITNSLYDTFNISKLLIGLIVSLLVFIIIYKGLKRISNFSNKFVPIMGIIYLFITIYVILSNFSLIPEVFNEIFRNAFDFKSIFSGLLGSAIIIGITRGVVSTESGIGTGSIASATSSSKDPESQGYMQMFGVYFTSFFVCTSTALLILIGLNKGININNYIGTNGIELVSEALKNGLGNIGTIVLLFAVFSFAFSTIISGYYYGESSFKYLFNIKDNKTIYLKIFVFIVLIIGSIMNPTSLWNLVDIGISMLAIINVYAMIKLRNKL